MKNSQLLIGIPLFILAGCSPANLENKAQSSEIPAADTVQTRSRTLDLPAPYATKSVANGCKVIGWPESLTPRAPQGFKVTRFATALQSPRWIYILPNGDILVAETRKEESALEKVGGAVTGLEKSHGKSEVANRITLFRDSNNDGKAELKSVFLSGLHMPFGMLVIGDHFYVANTDAVLMYDYKAGQTSVTGAGKKLIDLQPMGRHWTRNLIANADGSKIYISVGSSTDHAENGFGKEERRACIIEMNPDGSDQKIYASGLRNPVGMDWQPGTNTLWAAVNERDMLGDDLPPDYLTSVQPGGFYGWPYSYYGSHKDPRISDKNQRNDLVKRAIIPDVPLGSHTASLGLVFYRGRSFPASYHNGAFIGQHGSWNRSILSGYKVVFVPFRNGKPGEPEDFLQGFIAEEKKSTVYGRPVGVAVTGNGSLLVADDAGNTVWLVTYGQ